MRAMPCRLGEWSAISAPELPEELWKKKGGGVEPTSVLDTRRSPSPPTSTSTLSCGGGRDSAGVAAVSDVHRHAGVLGGRRDEWPPDLQPMPEMFGGEKCGVGVGIDDCWVDVMAGPPPSPPGGGHELPFFRWFAADIDDPSAATVATSASFGLVVDPAFGYDPPPPSTMHIPTTVSGDDFTHFHCSTTTAGRLMSPPILKPPPPSLPMPVSLQPNLYYNVHSLPLDEKPAVAMPANLSPHFNINQHQSHSTQNQSFFLPLPFGQPEPHHILLPPNPKRHQLDQPTPLPRPSFGDHDTVFRRNTTPSAPPFQHHLTRKLSKEEETALEQLGQAAEMVDAGNSVNARGILARLNHQLSSPAGKHPYLRASFYFKEALQRLLETVTLTSPSPLEVVYKIAAVKACTEVSPVLPFANFTANQAILEAMGGFPAIHIIDFDVGFGGQWASLIKELAGRAGGAPSIKITALVYAAEGNEFLELGLTRENLSHFAGELCIPFDFRVAAIDSFDASALAGEAIAVNLPVTLPSGQPSSAVLRLVKQLGPKMVVTLDRCAEQTDLPFPSHFQASLRSHAVLLDSLDAVNVSPDAVQKIERFLLGPRIEKLVAGRHCAGERLLPWRNRFTSAGLSPVAFSSFAETQAECLVKRLQLKGFHVERKQSSLCLCWQMGELVSVSAWSF